MHFTKPELLISSQRLSLLVWKHLLQSLTDLTLNPHWYIFFNKVLNHGKVVSMSFSLRLQIQKLFIGLNSFSLKEFGIMLLKAKSIDIQLVLLQPLCMVFDLLHRQLFLILQMTNLLFCLPHPHLIGRVPLPDSIDFFQQLLLVLFIFRQELILPLHIPVILRSEIIVDLDELFLKDLDLLEQIVVIECQLFNLNVDLPLITSQGLFFSDSLLVYLFDGVKYSVEELHPTIFVFFEQDIFKHEDLLVNTMYLVLEFDEIFSIIILLHHDGVDQLANDFSHFVLDVE